MAYYKYKTMLYERWQRVVEAGKDEVALRDLASGQCWTFSQLNAEAEAPAEESPVMLHPQGNSCAFILAVLRGWREGIMVCPLDSHHQPLALPATLPPGPRYCHLKTTPASMGVPRAVAFTEEQLAADAEPQWDCGPTGRIWA